MDHLTGALLDERLTPSVYRIWTAWESGDRNTAVSLLQEFMLPESPPHDSRSLHPGDRVLSDADRLLRSSFADTFPALLQRMLADPFNLLVPPARIAQAVWRQSPRDSVLRAVALGDLRWSADPFEPNTGQTPEADSLADLLRTHERWGLISRDPGELPYGGRPVIGDELAQVADAQKLGATYSVLTTASDPTGTGASEWWRTAGRDLPKFTLRNFLHDAFLLEDGRTGDPGSAWAAIRENHPGYAEGILIAWSTADVSAAEWAEAARFIARVPTEGFRDDLERLLLSR